jgi:septal ring factor EnvC (AmiA/AmiB activator)
MLEDKIYTTQEAADLLCVKLRAVQSRCKNENILRRSNRYIITKEHLTKWEKQYNSEQKAIIHANIEAIERNATQIASTERKPTQIAFDVVPEEIKRMQEQIKALYESNKVLNNTISLLNEEIEKLKEQSIAKQIDDTTRQFGWIKKDNK